MWEMGGEHWQSRRVLLAMWQSRREALPTGALGKGRHVSEPSRHGRGFREVNENGIFSSTAWTKPSLYCCYQTHPDYSTLKVKPFAYLSLFKLEIGFLSFFFPCCFYSSFVSREKKNPFKKIQIKNFSAFSQTNTD